MSLEVDFMKTLYNLTLDPLCENALDNFLKENEKDCYLNSDSELTFLGDDIWCEAISAILAGKNLLLVGEKSTGKNVLALNLAKLFQRPVYNVSININTDSESLLGCDSFKNSQVFFRPGPVSLAAQKGGFLILDEINMAKNEALSVLHASLDHRRKIDIPGYDSIKIHPACRFIATMNEDYAGTRPLNEALLSRFVVIRLPIISRENLIELITSRHKNMMADFLEEIANIFSDILTKYQAGEISSNALDIRGLLYSLDMIEVGLNPFDALKLGLINKSFDHFERTLLEDLIKVRISSKMSFSDVLKAN